MKKEESSEDIENTVEELAPAASQDKVRDILAGGDTRNFMGAGAQFSFAFIHRQLERLEERMVAETNQIRHEIRSRMDDIERFVKGEVAGVVDALAQEESRRAETVAQVMQDVQVVARFFEDKAELLEERVNDGERKLLLAFKQEAQETENRLRDLTRRLERDTKQLQESKADSARLSQMFSDLAGRLSDPGKRS